jgi:hypothetical protein
MWKSLRDFSVRQDPFSARTARTKCCAFLLASSLVAALLDGLFEHPARCSPVGLDVQIIEFQQCHKSFPQTPRSKDAAVNPVPL